MISSAEAALLISKCESEKTVLYLTFFLKDKSIHFFLKVNVANFDEGEALSLTTGNRGDILIIDLQNCRFEYGDERELPERLRPGLAETQEGNLRIILPSGERIMLSMLRADINDGY